MATNWTFLTIKSESDLVDTKFTNLPNVYSTTTGYEIYIHLYNENYRFYFATTRLQLSSVFGTNIPLVSLLLNNNIKELDTLSDSALVRNIVFKEKVLTSPQYVDSTWDLNQMLVINTSTKSDNGEKTLLKSVFSMALLPSLATTSITLPLSSTYLPLFLPSTIYNLNYMINYSQARATYIQKYLTGFYGFIIYLPYNDKSYVLNIVQQIDTPSTATPTQTTTTQQQTTISDPVYLTIRTIPGITLEYKPLLYGSTKLNIKYMFLFNKGDIDWWIKLFPSTNPSSLNTIISKLAINVNIDSTTRTNTPPLVSTFTNVSLKNNKMSNDRKTKIFIVIIIFIIVIMIYKFSK